MHNMGPLKSYMLFVSLFFATAWMKALVSVKEMRSFLVTSGQCEHLSLPVQDSKDASHSAAARTSVVHPVFFFCVCYTANCSVHSKCLHTKWHFFFISHTVSNTGASVVLWLYAEG